MAKEKKDKKPRPNKYAEKVAINVGFNEALQIFAKHANKTVKGKLEQQTEDANELVEA